MKLRWKLLLVFIALLFAPLLLVVAMHFKLKHDVASYKKQLLANGVKLAITDWIPPLSTNENSSSDYLAALRPFTILKFDRHPSPMRMVAPGHAQVGWKKDELYDGEFKTRTNVWESLRSDFAGNAEAFGELRDAIEKGELIFSVAYQQGFRARLPGLAPLKQGALWLSVATIFELHEGNKVEAKENLKALLRFLKNYKVEPLLISHLVRIACIQIAFSTTWETLQYPDWTDEELKEFQEAWSAIESEKLEATFSMERAMGIQMFAEAREAGQNPAMLVTASGTPSSFATDFDEFTTEVMTDPKAAFKALFNQPNQKIWRWVQSYREELNLLKMWQAGVEASRAIEKEKSYQPTLKNLERKLESMESLGGESVFGDSRSMVSRTLTKIASAEIARQLAITACALQRYKLESGHFPTELKELTPKILRSMPLDPINGQPLRYRLNQDGTFLLYSIGENGVDEGGDPNAEKSATHRGWTRPGLARYGRDWVWPLAATEEQIAEWERHESGGAK